MLGLKLNRVSKAGRGDLCSTFVTAVLQVKHDNTEHKFPYISNSIWLDQNQIRIETWFRIICGW